MPPCLSICIPTYNGLPHVGTLLDSLVQCLCQGFEIVVSDDCSVDGTWEYLEEYSKRESRVRVFRNDLNLGMDRNFARSVELANGDFIWLCGQDDLIAPEGITAVIGIINGDKPPDFLHMPYEMRSDASMVVDWMMDRSQKSPLRGSGLPDFVASNNEKLPTFLPEFVIRRSRWQRADVSRYFGTSYCQVGVFLEVSKDLRWSRLAECYVKGLLPRDGWQANHIAYAKIILGYFAMLNRALGQEGGLTETISCRQYFLHRRQLIYALLLIRAFNLENRVDLLGELHNALRKCSEIYWMATFFLELPRFLCRSLLRGIAFKREIRGWLSFRFSRL